MPGRVGHITHLFGKADSHGNVVMDGSCRVHNDVTGEDWAGRLVLLSGGNVVFAITDDQGSSFHPTSEATDEFGPSGETGQFTDQTPRRRTAKEKA